MPPAQQGTNPSSSPLGSISKIGSGMKKGIGLGIGASMLTGKGLGWAKDKLSFGFNWANYKTGGALSRTNWYLFILSAILYHVVKFGTRTLWDVLLLNVIYFLIVWIGILGDDERNSGTFRGMILIAALEVFLPLFIREIPFISNLTFIHAYLLNPYIKLWWIYYAVFKARTDSKIVYYIKVFILLFWLGVIFSVAWSSPVLFNQLNIEGDIYDYGSAQVFWNTVGKSSEFWTKTVQSTVDSVKGLRKAWQRQMDYATGDYYYGKVEENQDQTLGVFITDVKPADRLFYRDDDVSVWGTLNVKTLEDGVNVRVSCYYGKKDELTGLYKGDQTANQVMPKEEFSIYDIEEVDIDCRVPAGKILSETDRVTLTAEFNFETMSYLKAYFMDKGTIRSLRRQDIDPLDHYGITDKKPVARFTNGPVMLGIGTIDPPIGVADGETVNPRIGITLEPNTLWKGRIKEIKDVMVMVPDPMELDTQFCPEFEKVQAQDDCVDEYILHQSRPYVECLEEEADIILPDDKSKLGDNGLPKDKASAVKECLEKECILEYEGYNVYRLDISPSDPSMKNIGDTDRRFKTFSCRVNITNSTEVLQGAPLAIRYFRAKARYVYELEESTTVRTESFDKDKLDEIPSVRPPSDRKASVIIPWIFNQYGTHITEWSNKFGVDECLIAGLIATESAGDPKAKSSADAKGLMQLLDTTATDIRDKLPDDLKQSYIDYNIYDPKTNILFGTAYLKQMLSRYGLSEGDFSKISWNSMDADKQNRLRLAIASYNLGSGGVDSRCALPKDNWMGSDADSYYRQYEECIDVTQTKEHNRAVLEYMQACRTEGYDPESTVVQPDTPAMDFIGTYSMPFAQSKDDIQYPTQVPGTFYLIEAWQQDVSGKVKYLVNVYYGEQYRTDKELLIANLEIISEESAGNNRFNQDPSYPLIRFALGQTAAEAAQAAAGLESPATAAAYAAAQESAQASAEELQERTLKVFYLKSSKKTITEMRDDAMDANARRSYDVWWNESDRWVQAQFDGQNIKLAGITGDVFCTIPWNNAMQVSRCTQEKAAGIFAHMVKYETLDKAQTSTASMGQVRMTTVQIEFKQRFEDDCCKSCVYCSDFQCQTCADKCALNIIGRCQP